MEGRGRWGAYAAEEVPNKDYEDAAGDVGAGVDGLEGPALAIFVKHGIVFDSLQDGLGGDDVVGVDVAGELGGWVGGVLAGRVQRGLGRGCGLGALSLGGLAGSCCRRELWLFVLSCCSWSWSSSNSWCGGGFDRHRGYEIWCCCQVERSVGRSLIVKLLKVNTVSLIISAVSP